MATRLHDPVNEREPNQMAYQNDLLPKRHKMAQYTYAKDSSFSMRIQPAMENAHSELESLRKRVRELEHQNAEGLRTGWTESEFAKNAIRSMEQRFHDLFENSPDAIFVEDLDGNVLDVNQAACRLHDCEREELIGLNMRQLVPPDHLDQVQADFESLAEGQQRELESLSRSKAGREIPVDITVNRIEYLGQPALLLHVRDITKRKEVEEKSNQHQEQLRHVSRLSTMGQMVAGIAHEVNQPLYAILNYATACQKTLESSNDPAVEKVLQWTGKINDAAVRAGEITRRLSNYGRKTPTCYVELDLNEMVRESVALISMDARRYEITLEYDLESPAPITIGDPIQIHQVLVNLIRNAYEAHSEGENAHRNVAVSTRTSDEWVHVEVRDDGPGILAEDAQRLFDPFFTTKEDGMGMGLAVSRSIIESHGGKIAFSANRSKGASFEFTLARAIKGEQQ